MSLEDGILRDYMRAEGRDMSACIVDCSLEDTGFSYTMSLIQGKYKIYILYTLMEFGVVRFNEMQRYIGTVTYKTLSSTLKQMEANGLVSRKEYPQIPPKVEYSLTKKGESLMPIIHEMCEWGTSHRKDAERTDEKSIATADS